MQKAHNRILTLGEGEICRFKQTYVSILDVFLPPVWKTPWRTRPLSTDLLSKRPDLSVYAHLVEKLAAKQTPECNANNVVPVLSNPAASIQRMGPRQDAVPWTRRRVLGRRSTQLSPSAGSPSCTARTPTSTRPPKPCHATPPSTVRGKHEAITTIIIIIIIITIIILGPSCGQCPHTHTHHSSCTPSQSTHDWSWL